MVSQNRILSQDLKIDEFIFNLIHFRNSITLCHYIRVRNKLKTIISLTFAYSLWPVFWLACPGYKIDQELRLHRAVVYLCSSVQDPRKRLYPRHPAAAGGLCDVSPGRGPHQGQGRHEDVLGKGARGLHHGSAGGQHRVVQRWHGVMEETGKDTE